MSADNANLDCLQLGHETLVPVFASRVNVALFVDHNVIGLNHIRSVLARACTFFEFAAKLLHLPIAIEQDNGREDQRQPKQRQPKGQRQPKYSEARNCGENFLNVAHKPSGTTLAFEPAMLLGSFSNVKVKQFHTLKLINHPTRQSPNLSIECGERVHDPFKTAMEKLALPLRFSQLTKQFAA